MKNNSFYQGRKKQSYFWHITLGLLLSSFCVGITIHYFYKSIQPHDNVIAQHIQELKNIFADIHKNCTITGFAHKKNSIDFLNIASFAGSHIGPMQVRHPEKWEGPYIKDELKSQGKVYQVVQAKYGYFVIPGEGVKLHNGKIIGQDIIITPTTDIEKLMKDQKELVASNGRPLAARIATTVNQFETLLDSPLITAAPSVVGDDQ